MGPENIHTPYTEGNGISWGEGGGVLEDQKMKEMYEAFLEFPEGVCAGGGGGEGGLRHTYTRLRMYDIRKNPFCGRGMDIFWSYTLSQDCDQHLIEKLRKLCLHVCTFPYGIWEVINSIDIFFYTCISGLTNYLIIWMSKIKFGNS